MRGWDVGAEHRTESFVNALQIDQSMVVARKLNPGEVEQQPRRSPAVLAAHCT